MPQPLHRTCSYPGCFERTTERYCPAHKSLAAREYDQSRRDPNHNSRYGRRWRKIRALYIAKHPLCELCLLDGFHTPATDVHHIVHPDDGGSNADENLQALCKPCHSRITLHATNRHPQGRS